MNAFLTMWLDNVKLMFQVGAVSLLTVNLRIMHTHLQHVFTTLCKLDTVL